MRLMRMAFAGLLFCAPLFAAVKPCEELKGEIETRLKDKGVAGFTLDIVPADQIKEQKVVGSCDGGKNKITYTKDSVKKEEAAK